MQIITIFQERRNKLFTTADEKIRDTKQSIREAMNSLKEVVLDDCCGSDDYKPEVKNNIRRVFSMLLEAKDLLPGD